MTENKPIYYVNNKKCVNVSEFIIEIKKLYEKVQQKNEQLEQENEKLKKENTQLKQQMQRLYNYFADWCDDIMPQSNFSEVWDGVKEDEEWD